MPNADNASDSSSDEDETHKAVYTNVENTKINTALCETTRFSEYIREKCHSTEGPTRPKSGSSFSIKYLLGLDKSSSVDTSENLADDPKPISEMPTDSKNNCAYNICPRIKILKIIWIYLFNII